jgi:hypothetical protein
MENKIKQDGTLYIQFVDTRSPFLLPFLRGYKADFRRGRYMKTFKYPLTPC